MGFNGVEWDLIQWDLMGLNHQIIFGQIHGMGFEGMLKEILMGKLCKATKNLGHPIAAQMQL